jgi:hypothetical protein
MSIDFRVPHSAFVALPRTFPTPEGQTEEQWLEEFLQPYVEVYGEMDIEARAALGAQVDQARSQMLPDDGATLLYRPLNVPAFSLLHLQLFDARGRDLDEAVTEGLLPTQLLALPPVVEPWPQDDLGQGVKAAYLLSDPAPDGTRRGGLSYLFVVGDEVVRIFTQPAPPIVVSMMEEPVDWIVASLRVGDAEVQGLTRLG